MNDVDNNDGGVFSFLSFVAFGLFIWRLTTIDARRISNDKMCRGAWQMAHQKANGEPK